MSSSPATSAPIPFTPIFFCLTLSTAYLVYRTRYSSPVPQPGDSSKPSHSPSTDPRFRSFQKLYLTVYSLVMLGDWLQGPYVYALYDAYGYSQHDNAVLFVVGFGSSMVFGTFIGSLSDKLGRKNGCLVYVACYVGSCLTKHFNSFPVLSLGRLLGGVSTSLLFSVFDSWMINEHNARGFREELLGDTFGLAIFCNSCIAILAGLLANAAASAGEMREAVGEGMGGGPTKGDGKMYLGGYCAPFDLAIVVLTVAGIIIRSQWSENYGEDSSSNSGSSSSTSGSSRSSGISLVKDGISRVLGSTKITLCGAITSLFEGSMYTFVFMWTPALMGNGGGGVDDGEDSMRRRLSSSDSDSLPFGLIFATFMVSCMSGSSLFTLLTRDRNIPIETLSKYVFATSAVSLFIPVITENRLMVFVAFCIFEMTVGMYFPALGTLKSKIVPESQRSAIYNIFRIPLNFIVLGVLLSKMSMNTAFLLCGAMLSTACCLQSKLSEILLSEAANQGKTQDLETGELLREEAEKN